MVIIEFAILIALVWLIIKKGNLNFNLTVKVELPKTEPIMEEIKIEDDNGELDNLPSMDDVLKTVNEIWEGDEDEE